MKKFYSIIAGLLMTASVFAQAPQKMSFQAVLRDGSNALIISKEVGMQISILQGSETGKIVYIETQSPTTNTNGLVSLQIGAGLVVRGSFNTIDWANGPYFIKTETDPAGGTNYTISGASELLSVPYALHAKTAETVVGMPALKIGDSYQGGIIFWLDATGQHGLIAATFDQTWGGVQWYNGTNRYTSTTGDGLYAGAMNTTLIVATQMADNQTAHFAAKSCAFFGITVDGVFYGDWYLPSKYELNLLYLQKAAVGGFALANYWSSCESVNTNAWAQSFVNGSQILFNKDSTLGIRAIRAF